jgi:hypothetical protein
LESCCANFVEASSKELETSVLLECCYILPKEVETVELVPLRVGHSIEGAEAVVGTPSSAPQGDGGGNEVEGIEDGQGGDEVQIRKLHNGGRGFKFMGKIVSMRGMERVKERERG